MGLEQCVIVGQDSSPAWLRVRTLLASKAFPVEMRMIDNQLAFPDELPVDAWRELRLGVPAGMVTVRRESDRFVFVVWGNAEAPLLRARNALMWAFAQIGAGRIQTETGLVSIGDFEHQADLPDSWRQPLR